MYYYKRTIKSGYLTEIEYIKSLKPRNKKNVARGKNICKTKDGLALFWRIVRFFAFAT